jgi:4-carboxymuconolactone decarboxylase
MTRLPRLPRQELTPEQAELFDLISGGERADQRAPFPRVGPDNALEGPFNAMLYSPGTGKALQQVGVVVRYRSSLTDRCRELAILTVAAKWDSAYERYAHEGIARVVGVSEAEIAAVAAGKPLETEDPVERCVIRTARALANDSDLGDELYANAVDVLGEKRLFDLVTLVGYYASVALQLRVFRVVPPAE